MKAVVDPDRCQGHARCWEISPEVFTLDAEGHAHPLTEEVPTDLTPAAHRAQRNCPERAITLT
ncbi:ferredoxin [Actinocorallia sp. A-T 12471]|uniref:ferredoxin n=1 Tax=Actinocorallia sp. A-T 12471 TaxID=3089813 RepID=UPI0029D1ED82|nr:ferredoxin [Actinocorallia sp. A-T 12471]MDX6745135.1 ferredoxin [Actinocorallia sp. A-T 12471]